MDQLSASQLKAMVEDSQASLAAALGRIEAFRIREKQLMNELSQLRQQVHGGPDAAAATPQPSGPKAAPAQAQAPTAPPPASPATSVSAKKPEVQPAWTSPSGQPLYVSNNAADYPIHIIQGSKKIPGSLVVTPEYVDFVEVKARIRQEEFVGISTVKVDTAKDHGADADERGAQEGTSTSEPGGGTGVWQMLWSKSGVPQRQPFEASRSTREALHRHTQRWLGQVDSTTDDVVTEGGELQIAVPRNLMVGEANLHLVGEPSQVLTEAGARALASIIPPLERMKDWSLSYSTSKHGISLQTLYRKAIQGLPTVLVIKDFGGYTFGCYTPDSWRIAPRYYGSGETFVFQLEPFRVAYPWRSLSKEKNDFFQYGTPECLAVGGLGHFAIWVDADLHAGSSGTCGTFGSPCLAAAEDFKVQVIEMWQATG
ncbi:hypothetical protein HYH03_001017 [Edaphochlamys debaryana]|uniref:Oxidation resistance protein 1 n=1 Tax=Edaphochlamys debaryana TaxID=47281 RepID=A0A835YHB1_9CHLO|nr:hypothetical protein HYH03_001017 [Edaphochlamys debaryana]|eukprot:KAG2501203.1 hypothetical protein HYH03_001017 [Edaphochlamys debaryana]